MVKHKIPKLEYWANKFALEYWGRCVEHPVIWDKRVKRYDGYVKHINSHVLHIGMSPRTIAKRGKWSFEGILKHELCHYFFIVDGVAHHEHSKHFIEELKRVGGVLPFVVTKVNWKCRICGKILFSTRGRWSWNKYEKHKCGCKEFKVFGTSEGYFETEGY